MIKFLTFLALSIGFSSLTFSSPTHDELKEISALQSQARTYFETGDRENERLKRIAVLALKQDVETLRLALESCVICEKFEVGKYLLGSFDYQFDSLQIKTLRDYFQDAQIRIVESQKSFKPEEQEEILAFKKDDKGQVIPLSAKEIKLNILKLLAREYFRNGDREHERSMLVKIAEINRDFPSLKRALEQCCVCLKFEEGLALLNKNSCYLMTCEEQALREYFMRRRGQYMLQQLIIEGSTKSNL